MKKSTLFAAMLLLTGLNANAQTGYFTAGTNDDAETTFDFENAINFCPILVSDGVAEAMEQVGIKRDLRVDDTNTHLWIWDGTYEANDADGANSFGDFGGYIDMSVTSVGWSGLGFIDDRTVDFSFLDAGDYYFHLGTKGATNSQCIGFCDGKFSIGAEAFVDGGNTIKNVGNWVNDGEWYYLDIPVSAIYDVMGGKDNVFTTANGGQKAFKSNYFWALSGGTTGTHFIAENVFLYQKVTEGIDNVKADNGVEKVYDIQGREVANTNAAGLYVVKTAQGAKKIVKK